MVGVTLGWYGPESGLGGGVGAGIVVFAWIATALALRGGQGEGRLVAVTAGVGFLSAGGLLGSVATRAATAPTLVAWYEHAGRQGPDVAPVEIEGVLRRDAVRSEHGARLDLTVDRVKTRTGWTTVRGGVRVSVAGAYAARHVPTWLGGRRLRLPVTLRMAARYLNPGLSDQERQLRLRGTSLLGSTKSALLVEVVLDAGWSGELTARVRQAVRRRVDDTVGRYGRRSASLVTAVLIGDRAGLTEDDRRRLQAGGTYHVVAISGGNVAILSALLLGVLSLVVGRGRVAVVLTTVGLVAYASVVGGEPSVARATLAAVVFLAARAADHRTSALNTLGWTAVCLVAVTPLSIVEPGFWLTFGATLGILVGVAPLLGRIEPRLTLPPRLVRVARVGIALFLVSLCAEAILLPISAALFSRVTVAGLALNFVAVPLMTVTQVTGMLAVGFSFLSTDAASLVGFVAHLAASGIVESARLIDIWPALSWRVPPPAPWVTVVYYAGWAGCVASSPASVQRLTSVMVGVGATLVIVTGGVGGLSDRFATGPRGCGNLRHATRIVFLDVDQADATLVLTPSGESVLVDAAGRAGPGATSVVGERVVSPLLWAEGVRRLDYLVLTHGHPDHIGGAPAVVADFRPREIWEGVPVPSSNALQTLRAAAAEVGSAWRLVQAGDALQLGDVMVRVVHPPLPEWERPRTRNDDSIVIEVRYGDVSVVLPGDIGADVEASLAGAFSPAGVRVVKVPHHGSRTSSSDAFVAALRPDVAVVSAGRTSPFGHPAPTVVNRYLGAGARVYQTGNDGAVVVCTDGRLTRVETTAGARRLTLGRL